MGPAHGKWPVGSAFPSASGGEPTAGGAHPAPTCGDGELWSAGCPPHAEGPDGAGWESAWIDLGGEG
jgi:hypothetical protein